MNNLHRMFEEQGVGTGSVEFQCGACEEWFSAQVLNLPPFATRGSIKFMRGFLCPDCYSEYEKEQDRLR